MPALLRYNLYLDTGCDFTQSVTWTAGGPYPVNFAGATAQMMVRSAEGDPAALATISTTPSSSGSIVLGASPPGPFGATVSDLAALSAYNASAFTAGTTFYVQAGFGGGAAFYAWAPGSLLTPDGVEIVAGQSGVWLLTGTFVLSFTKSALSALVGLPRAVHDMLVTWSTGATTKTLEGDVLVDQTVTHP